MFFYNALIKHKIFFIILFTLGISGTASAALTDVYCNDDINSDRALIQSSIDNASPGDTLLLHGTCLLDGFVFIKNSNLSIKGDGEASGWSTVIRGEADNDGVPIGASGIRVGDPTNGDLQVSNISISGIKFSTLTRTVQVLPQIAPVAEPVPVEVCEAYDGTGNASNVTIENNWFDNFVRGAQVFGSANNIQIKNNLFTNHQDGDFVTSITLEGEDFVCGPLDNRVIVPAGNPRNSLISGNMITDTSLFNPAIFTNSTKKTTVKSNVILSQPGDLALIGIWMVFCEDCRVTNNDIDADGVGIIVPIYLQDFNFDSNFTLLWIRHSSNSLINNNTIRNALWGITVDAETTGYTITNNIFQNSAIADIVLCGVELDAFCDGEIAGTQPSFDNKVIGTNFSTSLLDFSGNNQLSGTFNLVNNPEVPEKVKDALQAKSAGRPQANP